MTSIQRRAARAARASCRAGASCSRAAARAAHDVRPRDARADGLLHGHRELLAPPVGARAGRAAADADRLLPRGLPAVRRRVAPDGAADRRDVQRRPLAQGDAGRVRLPPAVARSTTGRCGSTSGRQRARADDLRLGDAGRLRARRRRKGVVVEQIIRPTGLLDPEIEVRPVGTRSTTCSARSASASKTGDRVLVTTLTKRMAEDLTEYYSELGVRVRYLHSDIDTLERIEILRDLRRGEFDVLVGINLLREGLDMPEVSLVGDPRRRQGRLPAHRAVADPDDRPRGAQRARQGDHVRRPRDRLDEEGDRRDAPRAARCRRSTTARTASRPRRSRRRSTALEGSAAGRLRRRHQAGQEGRSEADIPLEELPQIISAMRREMFDLSRRWSSRRPPRSATASRSWKRSGSRWAGASSPGPARRAQRRECDALGSAGRLQRYSSRQIRTPSVSHWRSRRDFAA